MKISVIIPVYKVEKFLHRCVESVVKQDYKNLEIILVDDGSPDNCPQMCDEWAEKDERIKVVHKKNGGLSDARNAGLNVATGEFVTFLDSDDYFFPNFSNACKLAIENKQQHVLSFGKSKEKIYGKPYSISACMKLFNLNFLKEKNIKFLNGVYHEDVPFTLEILINTNKIKSYKENFYYYDVSSAESITREKNEAKFIKRFRDIYSSLEYVNQKYSNILNERQFAQFISRTAYGTIKLAHAIKSQEYQTEMVELINKNKKYFKHPLDFKDKLIRLYWNVFGLEKTIRFISKLYK